MLGASECAHMLDNHQFETRRAEVLSHPKLYHMTFSTMPKSDAYLLDIQGVARLGIALLVYLVPFMRMLSHRTP
jgi:hypothetical protein